MLLIPIANLKMSVSLAGVVPLTEEERAEERERRQERRLGAAVESSDDEGAQIIAMQIYSTHLPVVK